MKWITYRKEEDNIYFGEKLIGRVVQTLPSGDKNMPSGLFSPELNVVSAARTSFMGTTQDPSKDQKLFSRLFKDNHTSPFEASEFVVYADMSDIEWRILSEDMRYKIIVVRNFDYNSNSGYFKADLNNAIKMYQMHFDKRRQYIILYTLLEEIFRRYYPWTCGLLNISEAKDNSLNYTTTTTDRVNVLDRGWLEILDCNCTDRKFAELILENYPEWSPTGDTIHYDDIIEKYLNQKDNRLLSLFSIQLMVLAPTVTMWQWVRHRGFNFSFQSGRYLPFKEDEFYYPTSWRKQSTTNKQGSAGDLTDDELTDVLGDLYDQHGDLEPFDRMLDDCLGVEGLYDWYLKTGFNIYETMLKHDAAREQARLFLPAWGSYYHVLLKVDLLSLQRFLRLRTAADAQYEIRVYAQALSDAWSKIMPATAEIIKNMNYMPDRI